MKKILLTLLIIMLMISLAVVPITANADEGDFIKIETESVGFYRLVSDTMTLQFYLPINTYAQVIYDDGGSYYLAKYNDIIGYLRKSDVAVGLYSNVDNPYSTTVITLNAPKLVYPTINSNSPSTLSTDDTLIYIGKITDEVTWYAVKKNSSTEIYFVKESDVYVEPTQTEPAETTEPENEPPTNLVKVLLIIGIIIPAIIIVFLLFKPKRRRPRSPRYMDDSPRRRYEDDYYYNDDDYYDE